MKTLVLWLRAARAHFFTATVVPVLLGAALAWQRTGTVHWGLLAWTLLGCLAAHAGANLANDYYDWKLGCDDDNPHRSPFNGGAGLIQAGILRPAPVLQASLLCYGLAAGCGYVLSLTRGWLIWALGAGGFLVGVLYNATPFCLAYRGAGELLVGLGFGPGLVLGSYFVQTGTITPAAAWASLPVGLLITTVLYVNELPDYEADKRAGKRTWVVRLGTARAARGLRWLLAGIYGSLLGGAACGQLPPMALLGLLTVPAAWHIVVMATSFHDRPSALRPANALTVMLHSVTGLLLTLGVIMDRVARG